MPVTDTQMEDVSDVDGAGVSGPSPGSGSLFAGPSIGSIKCGRPYLHESDLRRKLANLGIDLARDEAARLQGVQLIDEVRNALQLPIITYIAACGYYHRFRLEFDPKDYQWADAALTCLFVACKSEDTLKKSRDILCANHNLKNPDRITTPDDKIFDQGAKSLIGLERNVIETLRFDFQVRNPFKILAKIVRTVLGSGADATEFFVKAYKVGTDMYKTFAPLKHTAFTCALAVARLTALVNRQHESKFESLDLSGLYTREEWVAEVVVDVLDLYTDHYRATLLGQEMNGHTFIDMKIKVNQKLERAGIPRYQIYCADCQRDGFPSTSLTESPTYHASPTETNSTTDRKSKGGTVRFLFDAAEVHREKATYESYTKDEWEEWQEEVEELIPDRGKRARADLGPEPRAPPREPRGPRGPRGHGRGGRGRGGHGAGATSAGRGGHDPGWHPRNRHEHRGGGGGGRGRGGGGSERGGGAASGFF